MKHQIFAVKDLQIKTYGPPLFVPSKEIAVRSFTEAVNARDPRAAQSPIHKYPHDYDLYQLGMFDDETAEFVTDTPVKVCNLASLKMDQPPAPIIPIGKKQHKPNKGRRPK